jgi:hypothetical protein
VITAGRMSQADTLWERNDFNNIATGAGTVEV